MASNFRNLKIWQKAYELEMKVYDVTTKYPPEEKYNLVSQTRSSANGVTAGIAEAHGRYYFADKSRALYVPRGECYETQSHLSVALGRGYITKQEFQNLDREYEGLARGINSYVSSLKKKT